MFGARIRKPFTGRDSIKLDASDFAPGAPSSYRSSINIRSAPSRSAPKYQTAVTPKWEPRPSVTPKPMVSSRAAMVSQRAGGIGGGGSTSPISYYVPSSGRRSPPLLSASSAMQSVLAPMVMRGSETAAASTITSATPSLAELAASLRTGNTSGGLAARSPASLSRSAGAPSLDSLLTSLNQRTRDEHKLSSPAPGGGASLASLTETLRSRRAENSARQTSDWESLGRSFGK